MSEIFVRLPQELQELIYYEYYRGGKYLNGKWICPLNKELVSNFSKIYKCPLYTQSMVILNIPNISNEKDIITYIITYIKKRNICSISNKRIKIYRSIVYDYIPISYICVRVLYKSHDGSKHFDTDFNIKY